MAVPPPGRKPSRNSACTDLAGSLAVKNGRFGPYVTDGVVNASLPKGVAPEELSIERAVELLAAREERMREQGKDPRAPKKKTPRSSTGGKSKSSTSARRRSTASKPA